MSIASARLAIGLALACASVVAAAETAPPPREVRRTEPERRAFEYRRLFEKVGRAGLPELTKSEDTGLALQASWELHKRLVKRSDVPGAKLHDFFPSDTYDPNEVRKFVAFLKERTKAPVPDWWAKNVSDLSVKKGDFHAHAGVDEERKDFVAVGDEDRKWYVKKGSTLTCSDDRCVYKSGSVTINLQRPRTPWDLFVGNTFVDVRGEQVTCVGVYSATYASGYDMGGFDTKNGKLLWTAKIWALWRGAHSGPSACHRVELTANADTVFVFGEEIGGLYLEAFDLKTGACRFRFCTTYWGDYSESWDIR